MATYELKNPRELHTLVEHLDLLWAVVNIETKLIIARFPTAFSAEEFLRQIPAERGHNRYSVKNLARYRQTDE